MANMTTQIQPLPVVHNSNGSVVNKMHTNYIQGNINDYDQSILSDIDLTFTTIIVWMRNIVMKIALTKSLKIVMSYH